MPIPSQRQWDEQFRNNRDKQLRKIKRSYNNIIKQVSQLTVGLSNNPNDEFYWRNYPSINKRVNKLMEQLFTDVYTDTVTGINSAWDTAVEKNNELVRYVYGVTLDALPKEIRETYLSNNVQALNNFIHRKDGGLKLSQKVWNNTRQFKQELELALEVGISRGNSAATIARNITLHLNDPDKLFRRIRDKDNGVLRLSKAATAYKPGRGRYRSSYKNANRLARNEINFSYEGSNSEKRKQLDFIVGVEIKVTPGHDPSSDKGGVSCLDLQGRYPKDFDFTYKWHVNCLCTSYQIIKSRDELNQDTEQILAGNTPNTPSKRAVTEMPASFTNYVKDNKKLLDGFKNTPRFIKSNEKLINK